MVCPVIQSGRFPVVAFDLTRSLVAYWKLDEASGNAVDEVSGHTLTNTGTLTYASGKLNNGANFDGTAKYLSMATPAALKTLGNGFSVSFWCKPTATTVTGRIISGLNGNSGAYIYMGGSGNTPTSIGFTVNNLSTGYIAGGQIFSAAVWSHVVCVYDPSQIGVAMLRVYLNGALANQINSANAAPQSFATGTTNLNLGSNAGATNLNGILDEVGIWSRALSPQEIYTLYGNNNLAVPPAYPFTVSNSSTIKLLDNFDDADNTLLTAHTPAPTNPDGLSWTSLVGACQFTILSNALTMPAVTKQILTMDPGTTDLTITFTGSTGSTGPGGYNAVAILFRIVDEDNYLWLHVKYTGEFLLLQRIAGTYSNVAVSGNTVWGSLNDQNDHVFALKQRGDQIMTFVDGVFKWSVTTTQFTGVTKIGLAQALEGSGSSGAICKSFEIRTGEQFPPYPLGIQ